MSLLLHMVLRIHGNDHAKLSVEENVLESIHGQQISPVEHVFPSLPKSPQEMGEPAMIETYTPGPVSFLTIVPSGPPIDEKEPSPGGLVIRC